MDAIAHLAVDGIHWRCAYASWFGVSFNKHARTHMIQLSSRRQRSGSLKFRFPKSTICVFDYWIRFVPPSTSNESPRAHSAIKWQALLKTFNIITISKQVTFCVIDRRQQIVHQINKNLSKFIGIKIGHYKVYFYDCYFSCSNVRRAHTSRVNSARNQSTAEVDAIPQTVIRINTELFWKSQQSHGRNCSSCGRWHSLTLCIRQLVRR